MVSSPPFPDLEQLRGVQSEEEVDLTSQHRPAQISSEPEAAKLPPSSAAFGRRSRLPQAEQHGAPLHSSCRSKKVELCLARVAMIVLTVASPLQ